MLLFYKPKYIIAKPPTVPTKTGLLAKAKCEKPFCGTKLITDCKQYYAMNRHNQHKRALGNWECIPLEAHRSLVPYPKRKSQ
jgi:hypothetical protein